MVLTYTFSVTCRIVQDV